MRVVFVVGLIAAAAALDSLEGYEFDDWADPDGTSPAEPESFLEVASSMTTSGGWKRCNFVGDLHALTDMTNRGNHYFEVMGEREYNALRGPLGADGKPIMDLQITQVPWQTESNMRSRHACEPKNPYITVAKDFALKCGENYLLYQAPKSTYHARSCSHTDSAYHPQTDYSRFYLKGSIKDPRKGNKVVSFDYEGYSLENYGHVNRKVQFADGSGSFVIKRNYCENRGCSANSAERRGYRGEIYGTLYCGGDDSNAVKINFRVRPCCNGGFYNNFHVEIPPNNRAGAKVTYGNMRNGFCGGWDKTTSEGAKWQTDHNACSSVDNVEPKRYKYKGSGTGLPGSQGTPDGRPQYPAHVSEFYTQHSCIKSFLPYQHESIFREFELKTKGKAWEYNSARWTSDGKAEDENDVAVVDENKLAAARVKCTTLRRKVDNRATEDLDEKVMKDKLLLVTTEMCAEDEYLGLEWDDEAMTKEICENVQEQLDTERVDIYCAQENLKELGISAADISQLGASNATATGRVEGVLDLYAQYTTELTASQDSVEFWDDGVCALDPLATNDLNVNCAAYKFTDTRVVS